MRLFPQASEQPCKDPPSHGTSWKSGDPNQVAAELTDSSCASAQGQLEAELAPQHTAWLVESRLLAMGPRDSEV